jgi:hypothetical protein
VPRYGIGVQADFTGVLYTNGAWNKQPAWTFTPPSLPVHNGNNMITWTLTLVGVPANYTAAFQATNGIAFKAATPPWPGSVPARQPDGTITADDNFQNQGAAQKFSYTTTVVLTPNAGSNGASGTFSNDPDVQNESGVMKYANGA